MPGIVVDTSVFIAALRSRHGASCRLLELTGDARRELDLSVAHALEYEAVGKREASKLGIPASAIDDIVDMLCERAGIMQSAFDCVPRLPIRTTTSCSNSRSLHDAISS